MGGGTSGFGTSDGYHGPYKAIINQRVQEIKQDIKGSINYLERYVSSFIISPIKQKTSDFKREIKNLREVYKRYH